MQEAPKAHLSEKSIGLGHICLLNRQHPDHDQPISNDDRYKDGISQEARMEGISPQQTVEVSFHEIIETLNVLVNEGSSIGSHMLDLIAPPKLTSEITQLPPLNQRFSCVICVVAKSSRLAYSSRRMSTSVISDRQWALPKMNEFSVAHQWTRASLMEDSD